MIRLWPTLGLAAILAAGCGGPRKPSASKQEGEAPKPRVTAEGRVRLTLEDSSGERSWEGSGQGLKAEVEGEQAELSDLTCTFREKRQVVMEASAGRARVDWLQREVVLSGGVRARSKLGHGEIRADRVTWSVEDGIVRASGSLEYRSGNARATALQLSADTALKVVHLTDTVLHMSESVAARKAGR